MNMKKLPFFILVHICFLACVKTPEESLVSSVSLNQSTVAMVEGETAQLVATILPSDAADKKVLWTSSKQSVAIVSDTGLVNAITEGTSTITASAGGKSAICTVTVSKKVIEVSFVELNKSTLELVEGDSETLIATVKPDDATDKTVTWISSDTSVATVSEGTVTAIVGGTATITAKAGDKSATCAVTVTVPVSSITLSQTALTLEVGTTATLTAMVKPDNATDKTVTWTSSNKSVATVDAGGVVSAVAVGNTTITVAANDGSGKQTTCSVSVKNSYPVGSVDLGLSIYWAKSNLSTCGLCDNPEDYGDYYAWGETEPKSSYDWSTYKWSSNNFHDYHGLTKYNTMSNCGAVDNKTVLDPEDDAAHVKLGSKWRMPTYAEWTELNDNCTWTWTSDYNGTGVAGNIVTSNVIGYTDKSIFLPAAGAWYDTSYAVGTYGYYWSSSLKTDQPNYANLVMTGPGGGAIWVFGGRFIGLSVRPVSE